MISTWKRSLIADARELLRDRVEDARVVALGKPADDIAGASPRSPYCVADRPRPLVLRRAVRADEHPRPERVEDAEADAGDVDGVGHHLLRVARLLGVVRRHLEADPRPEGGEEARRRQRRAPKTRAAPSTPSPPLKIPAGLSACQTMPSGPPPCTSDGEGEDHQDDELAEQADAEDPGDDLDVEVRDDEHERDEAEGVDAPVHVEAAGQVEDARLREVRRDAVDARR